MENQSIPVTNMELVGQQTEIQIKKPKRVLHFSDGTLEEYSSEEEDRVDGDTKSNSEPDVDEKKLNWPTWIKYKTWKGGNKLLSAADYVGEGLADFFGITTPKYYYEIEEAKRQKSKEKEEKENAWTKTAEEKKMETTVSSQPTSEKIEIPDKW